MTSKSPAQVAGQSLSWIRRLFFAFRQRIAFVTRLEAELAFVYFIQKCSRRPVPSKVVEIVIFLSSLIGQNASGRRGSVPFQPKLYNYNSKGESILLF